MNWTKVTDSYPPPHAKYTVKRGDYAPIYFVATPCYGMHSPWWVPSTPQGETDPINIESIDSWRPIDEI